jgi:hypothetical protein
LPIEVLIKRGGLGLISTIAISDQELGLQQESISFPCLAPIRPKDHST